MTNIKRSLFCIVIASSVSVDYASAQCAACTSVSKFGADVVGSTADATNTTLNTAQGVASAYADTSQALYDTSDEVVSAIIAGSGEVTAEIVRSSEVNTRLMDAMANQLEQLYKSRLIADANIKAAETHGAANVHSSSCEPFGRVRDATLHRKLLQDYRAQQLKDRTDDVRDRSMDFAVTSLASLGDNIYLEGDATLAMAQVSLITGENSFDVSPDTIAALTQRGLGNATEESLQVMSGWLRASGAGLDVSAQIAKRTRPPTDPQNPKGQSVSTIEDFWLDAERAVSPGGLLEDAQASEIKLLRALARRQALGNRIKLEQLENAMALARMSASELGYLTEDALRKSKQGIDQTVIDSAVRKGEIRER